MSINVLAATPESKKDMPINHEIDTVDEPETIEENEEKPKETFEVSSLVCWIAGSGKPPSLG